MRTFLREYGLPALTLGITVVTTTANGARFMQNYLEGLPPVIRDVDLWPWGWLAAHPSLYLSGLAFSLTLLAILLTHEFGHYFACRVHAIDSTLPWVLPSPTLSGTAGAVIRIRSRIPSRNALMDVGIYGPLVGYIVSLIAVTAGYLLSPDRASHVRGIHFGAAPLTIRLVHHVLAYWNPQLPAFDQLAPHPVLIAGWIGLFITSLNLIPGGQLDGGHILYALSPRTHRYVTRVLPAVLLLAGIFYWIGWIFWGMLLLIPAMKHPRVASDNGLDRGRFALGIVGLVLLLLTITPTPFDGNSVIALLR